MGVVSIAARGARVARPFADVVRATEQAAQAGGHIAVLPGTQALERRLRKLIDPPQAPPSEDALAVTALGPGTRLEAVKAALAHRRRSGGGALAILVGTPAERRALEAELLEGHEMEPSNLAHVPSLEGPGAEAALDAIVDALGDRAIAAGRRAPGLRGAVARRLISRASRRGATVGALPLGGADLPVLALLQVRLVSELAALHDRPFGAARFLEAAAVAGAGLGWRAVGRSAVGLVPGAGWAIRGGIAYGATRAVGEAANARLAAGHDLVEGGPVEAVKARLEPLLAKLPGRSA